MTRPEQVSAEDVIDTRDSARKQSWERLPGQVPVNVADLEAIKDWWYGEDGDDDPLPTNPETKRALYVLFDAIPEPEWEPTDDMVKKYRDLRAFLHGYTANADEARRDLKAMHREGLTP